MNLSGKPYTWRLFNGQEWLSIDNDDVIEAAYCQPGAKRIHINSILGPLVIEFDSMTVTGPFNPLKVQRLTFMSQGQSESIGWYYKDNSCWCEYGRGIPDTSVNSDYLEGWYNSQPKGTISFSMGSNSYIIDFSEMQQKNIITHKTRKVRRRPKSVSKSSSKQSRKSPAQSPITSIHSPYPVFSPVFSPTWEFMGDGVWTEYQKPGCSLDSQDIERLFQQNPNNKIRFTVGCYSYTLDFNAMQQTNDHYGTKRSIRRTIQGIQPNSSAPGSVRWQYLDHHWKDYVQGQGQGECSISSQAIEAQYQLNQYELMNFSSPNFDYQINFTEMKQTNLLTGTRRNIRRLQP